MKMFFEIISFFSLISYSASQEEPLSNQLYKDLMKDYEKAVLPMYNRSESVEVQFGISLQQILDVDVHNSRFRALLWYNYQWSDKRLRFVDSEASKTGVNSLRISGNDIWMPDIRPYNNLNSAKVHESDVVVYNDGTCSFVPVVELTTSCEYDLKWFPYDKQICILKFGSWTYDGTKINLTNMADYVDISTYQESPGWVLLSAKVKRSVQRYACCPEPYVDITYTLEIQRRGSKYAWEYISPAVILTLLIPVLFLLPSENASRFVLGTGMLICSLLLMMMLKTELPHELISRPMLGCYLDMMFILVSIGLVISAIVHNIACKNNGLSSPPQLVKTIFLNIFGKLVCVRYDRKYGVPTSDSTDPEGSVHTDNQTSVMQAAAYEWRLIGKVLDRVFLVLFLVVVCIGSIAVLPMGS